MKKMKPPAEARRAHERGADKRSGMKKPKQEKGRAGKSANKPAPAKTVSELCRTVFDAIERLEKLALQGDDKAARGLWSLAALSNSKLSPLLRAPGPLLRAAIEGAPACPVNLPASRKRREMLTAEVVSRGLAKGCEINALGKFDSNAPMSRAVAAVYQLCLRRVRKNPKHPGFDMFDGKAGSFSGWVEWRDATAAKIPQKLTRENAREWADLAEPLLKIFWGERFDEHRDFAPYGKSAAAVGTLRGELRRLWRQSWRTLANP